MSGLADQKAQPDHTQIASLALGVSTAGELARSLRGDVGVEVRRVESKHVRSEIEPGHRRLRDSDLRLLQIVISDLLRYAMKRLPAKGRARQTRQACHTRVKKLCQIALRSRLARPLDSYRHRQLAHRWALLGTKIAASTVDVGNQIQLLGDPDQCPDIAELARAHGMRGTQIRDGRRRGRPEHNLACDRAASDGVPHRLGCVAVAMAVDFSLKYMHILTCIISKVINQANLTEKLTSQTSQTLPDFAKVGLGVRAMENFVLS